MYRFVLILIPVMFVMAGCTTLRQTEPTQTARHQLLLSTAADNVGAQIDPNLPPGTRIYLDTDNFESEDEYHSQYMIGAVTAALLRQGYALARSTSEADTIADISNGAMSINRVDKLFGIPSGDIPIPLTGTLATPELSLWKSNRRTGIAKVLLTFYDAETGILQAGGVPLYGYSHYDRSSLLFYGTTDTDLKDERPKTKKK